MGVLSSGALTLIDWAKRRDPDGKTARIVEMLAQVNEPLADMVYVESNEPSSHRLTLRATLPSVYWRSLNAGVAPSKSTTAQSVEGVAILEAWSEVDKHLADLSGDQAAFRLSEANAFLEAMAQEHAQTLFYGNVGTAPEEFNGFATRFAATSGTYGENIVQEGSTVGGGGSGSDNSSVWLVGWGENSVHGIFPKGSKAGIEHEDLGEVTVEVTAGVAGNRMRAYQDHFVMRTGLVLKDWRYLVRIPNIDISNLVTKSSAADLIQLMIKAIHRIPSLNSCRPAFYMNRSCIEMLDIQMRDDVMAGGQLKYENVDGKPVMSFRGIPVRKCDALTETESAVA
jgi:hypothetical protein